jgi:hypothetical protein
MVYNPVTSEQQRKQQANLERRNQRDAAWTKFKVGMADAMMGIPIQMATTGGTELVKRKMAGAFPTVEEEGQALQNVREGVLTDNLRALSGALGMTGATERQEEIESSRAHIRRGTAPPEWGPTSGEYKGIEKGIGGIEQPVLNKWIQERDEILGRQKAAHGAMLTKPVGATREQTQSVSWDPNADPSTGLMEAWLATEEKDTARLQELEGYIGAMQDTIAGKRQAGRVAEQKRDLSRLEKRQKVFEERIPDLIHGISTTGLSVTGISDEEVAARNRARRAKTPAKVPHKLIGELNSAMKAFNEAPNATTMKRVEESKKALGIWEQATYGTGTRIPAPVNNALTKAEEVSIAGTSVAKAAMVLSSSKLGPISPKVLLTIINSTSAMSIAQSPKFRKILENSRGGSIATGIAALAVSDEGLVRDYLFEVASQDQLKITIKRAQRKVLKKGGGG